MEMALLQKVSWAECGHNQAPMKPQAASKIASFGNVISNLGGGLCSLRPNGKVLSLTQPDANTLAEV